MITKILLNDLVIFTYIIKFKLLKNQSHEILTVNYFDMKE